MPEGKNTASPPLGRRSALDFPRGAITDIGGGKNTLANGLVRSHSSLHSGVSIHTSLLHYNTVSPRS